MIQKKVCLLGAFATGKTSLVSRFVTSAFSDRYLTTAGVKIDRKTVRLDGLELDLIIWDLHGDDEFQKVRMSYLRGASGCLLVVDGTRLATYDKAVQLYNEVQRVLGAVPIVMAFNKADLAAAWAVDEPALAALPLVVVKTSAKTGAGVEAAFNALARAMAAV